MKNKNLMACLTISITCFFAINLLAQDHVIDSLCNVLKTEREDNSNKVNTWNALSKKLWRTGKYDTAMNYADSAKILAEKLGYKKGLALAFRNIGTAYYEQGDYSGGLEYYAKALAIDKQTGHKDGIAINLGDMGVVYAAKGDYPKALEHYFKALAINKEISDTNNMEANLENIGTVYDDLGSYSKSLEYYFNSLAISLKKKNKQGIAAGYGNIGAVYSDQDNYPRALQFYAKALEMDRQMGDEDGVAINLGNIGSVYNKQGNYFLALKYEFKALAIEKEIGSKEGMVSVLNSIGNDYTKYKKYKQAKAEIDLALAISKDMGSKEDIKNSYLGLSATDSAIGNYKTAFADYKNYIIYRDSLINEANIKKTVRIEMNYRFKQQEAAQRAAQEKKDVMAAAKSKRQKILILLFASIAVTLSLLLFNIFNALKNTRKQKLLVEKQKVLVELKALRAQMNPHFIFNAINSIKQFIFENDSEAADRHLSRFASLIRKVLENSKQENIALAEEIQMLTLYIELEMLRFAGKFTYKIETDEHIDPGKVLISPLIIQPYAENAIWHGLMPQDKPGALVIKFEKEGDMLKCTIDDNGIGRKRSAEIKKEKHHKSMGLSITKERLEILNMINKSKMNLQFIDKTNTDGSSAGTRVELFVPYTLT